MTDLVERLRGQYSMGPFGKRDFAPYVPAIQIEAADAIETLRAGIWALLAVTEHGSNSGKVFAARVAAYSALRATGGAEPPGLPVNEGAQRNGD